MNKQQTNHYEDIVTVPVSYMKPGNVVEHVPVTFRIVQDKNRYKVASLCSEEQRRLTDLPAVFYFETIGDKVLVKKRALTNVAHDILLKIIHQNKNHEKKYLFRRIFQMKP